MPATSEKAVADHLLQTNEEYQRLARQHADYDRRLSQLAELHHPNLDEQVEETRLKKLKLHLKDKMQKLVLANTDTMH